MRSTAQNATYYLRRETVPVITQTRAENHVHYWIWHQNIAFTWFANSPSWPVSKESCPKNRAQLQRLILQEVKGIGGKFQELTSSLSTSISLSSSLMASPSSEVALPRDIRTCLRKRRRKGVLQLTNHHRRYQTLFVIGYWLSLPKQLFIGNLFVVTSCGLLQSLLMQH